MPKIASINDDAWSPLTRARLKMTSFELLKDWDITSVAISYICLKKVIKENAALFDFMPCCHTFQMVLQREGIVISSECLITLISNLNLINEWFEINLRSMSR